MRKFIVLKKKILLNLSVLILAAHLLPVNVEGQTGDFARWVNPFIGTGGHGHTFPGAVMPFGMVQLSPDTRIDNWDGSSGYHYSDDIIYGFSHTHLSGTGIPDGADILFMPTVGEPQFFAREGDKLVNGYASKFSHSNEKAEPGYYSVKLDDDGILAEMTATRRVGMHKYTFPASSEAKITLDLTWRDKTLMSQIDVKGDRIEGWRRSSSWAKDQTIYFVAQFSERFAAPYWYHEYTYPTPHITKDQAWINSSLGEHIRVSLPFTKPQNRQILIKVAISYVSIEGARRNLEAELPDWDFDRVRAEAKAAWNRELSKIQVSGGTDDQRTTFYTALYHTMIHPSLFSDVDGQYRGHDGKVHQLEGYSDYRDTEKQSIANPKSKSQNSKSEHYTVFSLWDTFRATHPLYTIIDQKRTVDFINTFIRQYEQGGRLPVWELWGEETDTMIGYHAVSVIADAMAKGIDGFDYEKAYEAARHSANLDHHGLAAYRRRGYISTEDENESVSKTLEYAYNDWCVASMAEVLIRRRQEANWANGSSVEDKYIKEKRADYEKHLIRARNFENLFDPATKFFRPKKNGGFIQPFSPNEVTFHFTEGNSWQYSFFVPQDVSRLMELMGGREKFIEKLDELFATETKLTGRDQPDITGLIGQYAHGNEPSHHIAYLYNYAHAPSKTQKRVRQILDEFYKNQPDGLIGNEDAGQMSAWYVLSAAAIYPVTPGSVRYDLGTPLFPEVRFRLENGKTFIIKAPKVSPRNIYIQSAKWNGKPYGESSISHSMITSGGVLELEMFDKPNDRAFSKYSEIGINREVPIVPVIDGERVFRDRTTIRLIASKPDLKIHFTTDGSEPTQSSPEYTAPFEISGTTALKAVTVASDGRLSPAVEAMFFKRRNDWTVKIASPYSRQYTGGGDDALIDGVRGLVNFASGEWQGYHGKTFEAVIDLQRETEVRSIAGSFLQAALSWIWMPSRVQFEVSLDGEHFTQVADIQTDFPLTEMEPAVREFGREITPTKARFVRVRAENIGKIPEWHPGAGGTPWIFVDEIIIN